jgi:hypothetical protein
VVSKRREKRKGLKRDQKQRRKGAASNSRVTTKTAEAKHHQTSIIHTYFSTLFLFSAQIVHLILTYPPPVLVLFRATYTRASARVPREWEVASRALEDEIHAWPLGRKLNVKRSTNPYINHRAKFRFQHTQTAGVSAYERERNGGTFRCRTWYVTESKYTLQDKFWVYVYPHPSPQDMRKLGGVHGTYFILRALESCKNPSTRGYY